MAMAEDAQFRQALDQQLGRVREALLASHAQAVQGLRAEVGRLQDTASPERGKPARADSGTNTPVCRADDAQKEPGPEKERPASHELRVPGGARQAFGKRKAKSQQSFSVEHETAQFAAITIPVLPTHPGVPGHVSIVKCISPGESGGSSPCASGRNSPRVMLNDRDLEPDSNSCQRTVTITNQRRTPRPSGHSDISAISLQASDKSKASSFLEAEDIRDLAILQEEGKAWRKREQSFARRERQRLAGGMDAIFRSRLSAQGRLASSELLDQDETWFVKARCLALRVVESMYFEMAVSFVIGAQAVLIGMETSHITRDGATPLPLVVLDHTFLLIYILELLLRLLAYGFRRCCKSNWIRFDMVLAVLGVLDILVALLFIEGMPMEAVMFIRTLRIFRLARAARLMVQFRTLWTLVQCLMNSMGTLLWTLLILLALCYAFAILGLLIFTAPMQQGLHSYGEEYDEIVEGHFGTLLDAMLTMFRFATLDSISAVYGPLISARPAVTPYFVALVLITSIALLNLVTAVMVEGSMTQSNMDQEAKRAWEDQRRRALVPKLTRLFSSLDMDGSGTVDLNEIKAADELHADEMQAICNGADLEDIFRQLDYNLDGRVDIHEFCEGMLKAGSGKPVELHAIMRQCSDIIGTTRKVVELLEQQTQAVP